MPFIRPKGSPKVPGSGRRRGTRNRRTVAAFALASELMNDVEYQYRFRRDFTRRRVHPSIETLIWHYVAGKPKESIQMTGSIDFSERLEAERELFGKLERRAAGGNRGGARALVDRVMVMAKANALTPGVVVSRRASVEDGESSDAPNPTCTGTDVDRSGEGDAPLNRDRGKARRTPTPVGVSQSPAAGVD